jgi:hypothetical protein
MKTQAAGTAVNARLVSWFRREDLDNRLFYLQNDTFTARTFALALVRPAFMRLAFPKMVRYH